MAKRTGGVHISASDLLRDAIENKTARGLVVQEYVQEKTSVPDLIVSKMVIERLQEADCQTQGWVLSGFPTTLGQVEAIKREGIKLDHFIMLFSPYEVLKTRVDGRSYDPLTGSRYHVTFLPSWNPKVTKRLRNINTTDRDIINGVREFRKNTKLLKQCYADIFFEVDGTKKPSQVYKDIRRCVFKGKPKE
eukprot:CAMPEP_0113298708 /NCGR_PEP_ID=MMETSP0010_2-20120614/1040_1 /TAXON_ID=216773 ORGANISM="Corethron hystrix, Strain 308" /NCGR_SAMPLE_ID=MMETSP0010_2 /ASSEMBLY_ACC=CAM_ASM_000155 /LENGTH=190 /DNA_ID=CAMNT_0000151807 /DNA_START=434 /DNA_END=1006 /DNA_ORIENTATION=- /assembly_acc=CAM_ASM_000155